MKEWRVHPEGETKEGAKKWRYCQNLTCDKPHYTYIPFHGVGHEAIPVRAVRRVEILMCRLVRRAYQRVFRRYTGR